MLDKLKDLDVKMSIKPRYLFSHSDRFTEHLGDLIEEHGERSHCKLKYFHVNANIKIL